MLQSDDEHHKPKKTAFNPAPRPVDLIDAGMARGRLERSRAARRFIRRMFGGN